MSRKGIINQVFTGFLASISAFCIGLNFGWISPNIARWLSSDSDIKMTLSESSWVVAFLPIGSAFPNVLGSFFVNKFGRKTILLATSPVLIISWIIVIFTRSVEWLYFARFLQGCSMAIVYIVLPIYLAEVSGNEVRGFVGTILIGCSNVGLLMEYTLGSYLNYETLVYINLAFPVIYFIVFSKSPETPYFLTLKRRRSEALKCLAWLRGVEASEVQDEMQTIIDSVESEQGIQAGFKDLFATHAARKGTLVASTVQFVYGLSGNLAILAVASYIFEAAGKSFLSSEYFSIIIALVQVCALFFSGPSIDRLGRRFLLLWSIFICGVCQGIVTLFFYFKTISDVSAYSWVPVVFFSVYFFFTTVGTGSMIGLFAAELFPTYLRGFSSLFASLIGVISAIISLKSYQLIADSVGFYVNHLIFTSVCVIGFLVIYFTLPETKGLSFDEIQRLLSRKNKKDLNVFV